MKLIPRYIRTSVIQSVLLCFLTLAGVQCFINLINVSGDIGKGHLSLAMAVLYVLMKLPADLYQMFPMVGFVGCLIGLGRLSSSSELIVVRAAGVSIGRIAMCVVTAAAILIAFITLMGELVAPQLSEAAEHIRSGNSVDSVTSLHDVWLHENHSYLYIGKVLSSHKVETVNRFDIDSNHHLKLYVSGEYAVKVNGKWSIRNASVFRLGEQASVEQYDQLPLNMTIQPTMLVPKKIDLRDESIAYLWGKFHYLKKVGLDPGQITFTLWQHIVQPFTTIVMICLGVPFTLGSLRDSSGGTRLVIGVLVGFGFYMLNEFVGPMALIYQVPAVLAATLPSVLFLSCYLLMLRRID